MPTLGILEPRMGSTRLPGKVLRKLAGRTVLDRVVRAARASGVLDDLVVATTTDAVDDVLETHESDMVMRFTADCPLLDSRLVAMAWRVFGAADVDYLTTSIARTLP